MFDFKFIPLKTEQEALLAGYDCEKNGSNVENCHFPFFARPELTKAWEKGKKAAKWEISKSL